MALPTRVERGTSGLDVMRQDFNSMLGRFFGGGLLRDGDETALLELPASFGVDIREDADHIYVEADLPGFRKDEVDITLENGMLTISAEKKQENELAEPGSPRKSRQQNGGYLLHERRYQRFVRSFTLPPSLDEQDVQATYENGVLKITLNKRVEAKPKRIPVA